MISNFENSCAKALLLKIYFQEQTYHHKIKVISRKQTKKKENKRQDMFFSINRSAF